MALSFNRQLLTPRQIYTLRYGNCTVTTTTPEPICTCKYDRYIYTIVYSDTKGFYIYVV